MRKRALLIAEKPSARQDMEAAYKCLPTDYPYEIEFVNAYGHLLSLQTPDEYCEEWANRSDASILPIIPDNWKYKVINKQFFEISKKISNGNYDFIINACDPEREGFLIFDTIYRQSHCRLEVKRLWFSDQTKDTLVEAFQNLRDYSEYQGYCTSALFRSILDWLIGMNFSRAASIATNSKFVIGRCITVILAIIVSRENAIESFIPVDYFEYMAKFRTKNGEIYNAMLINHENKEFKYRFPDRNLLEDMSFQSEQFYIESVEEEQQHIKPKSLMNLKDLQSECSSLYGFTPLKTLAIAQSLYETHKILSYPRTDCRYITTSIAENFKQMIENLDIPEISCFSTQILSNPEWIKAATENKNYVNNKKIVDHPALIPTKIKPEMEKLSDEESKVYMVVIKRFLSIFFPDCIYKKTGVITSCGSARFYTSGRILLQSGWKELYPSEPDDQLIPDFTPNELVSFHDGEILNKKTQAPPRYSNSSLLDAMENIGNIITDENLKKVMKIKSGIGTSSTRGELIEKVVNYEWVERVKKGKTTYFIPTKVGRAIIKALEGQEIISPEFTASWEEQFVQMEKTNTVNQEIYTNIISYVSTNTARLLAELKPSEDFQKEIKSLGICPNCGQFPVVETKNVFLCSGYFVTDEDGNRTPLCTFGVKKTISGATITASDVETLLKTGYTPKKKFTWSNNKKGEKKLMLKNSTDNESTGKIQRVSVTFAPYDEVGSCPICSDAVLSLSKVFKCKNNECDFHLFKTFRNAKISDSEAGKLLNGNQIKKTLKNKMKEPYSVSIFLNKDTHELDLIYPKQEKK